MILKDKKQSELSTEVITHRLNVKGEEDKYITKKWAEFIYRQLTDENKNVIVISNPESLTYITRYKSEVNLIPLDWEKRSFEDTLFLSNLSNSQKEMVREIWESRGKEKKQRTNGILQNIISKVKGEF